MQHLYRIKFCDGHNILVFYCLSTLNYFNQNKTQQECNGEFYLCLHFKEQNLQKYVQYQTDSINTHKSWKISYTSVHMLRSLHLFHSWKGLNFLETTHFSTRMSCHNLLIRLHIRRVRHRLGNNSAVLLDHHESKPVKEK